MGSVYAVVNAEPEIQAYSFARFSRSSDSCKDAIMRLTSENAATFFDKYFGHKSIADIGHLAIAVEGVSQLVADELELPWDGPWDGQERSTRYQDFAKREIYRPKELGVGEAFYDEIIGQLFDLYDEVSKEFALDVARYCLPMATLTSVGQVVSIRTLEKQICRLLSSEFSEVRAVAEQMKEMCCQSAFNVLREKLLRTQMVDLLPSRLTEEERKELQRQFGEGFEILLEGIQEHILPEVKPAPTLARYLSESDYLINTRNSLRSKSKWLFSNLTPVVGATRTRVDYCRVFSALDPVEQVVALALYWQAEGCSLGEVVRKVRSLDDRYKREIFDACSIFRGEHDEALPLFRVGNQFAMEFMLDNGADRDMKRHRRCVQIPQRPLSRLGFVLPKPLKGNSLEWKYVKVMTEVQRKVRGLEMATDWKVAAYALPFAQIRPRVYLFDLAEIDYVARLRTKHGGHFEYRQRSYDMYEQVITQDERLKSFLSATNPND